MNRSATDFESAPDRFLCDEMLKGLARWLRAAGYDTLVAADSAPDREILACALDEGRWLITRDAKLAEHRHAEQAVVVLSGNEMSACAREAGERLAVDWLARPFSRCLICNTLLQPAPEEQAQAKRETLRGSVGAIRHCPRCDQLFWSGGHVRRMRARLEDWQAGLFG